MLNMFRLRCLEFFILVFTTTWCIGMSSWNPEDFPNPRRDVNSCGRGGKKSWVCDPNQILTPGQADSLDLAIQDMMAGLDCLCPGCILPFPVGVAIVSSIGDSSHGNETAEFARYLRDKSWKFGNCSDDVIIVFSRHTSQVFTAFGSNTQAKLSTACAQKIHEDSLSYFVNFRFYEGIQYLIAQYRDVLTGEKKCSSETEGGFDVVPVIAAVLVVGLVFVACGLVMWWACRRGIKGPCSFQIGGRRSRSGSADGSGGGDDGFDGGDDGGDGGDGD